jgi:hypothetical protein
MKNLLLFSVIISFLGCAATKHETSNPLKIEFQIQNLWHDIMPSVLQESKIYTDFDLALTNIFDIEISAISLENFKILNEQKNIFLPLFLPNPGRIQNLTFLPNETKKFQIRGEANPQTSAFLLNNDRFYISFDIRNRNNFVFNYTSPKIRLERVF